MSQLNAVQMDLSLSDRTMFSSWFFFAPLFAKNQFCVIIITLPKRTNRSPAHILAALTCLITPFRVVISDLTPLVVRFVANLAPDNVSQVFFFSFSLEQNPLPIRSGLITHNYDYKRSCCARFQQATSIIDALSIARLFRVLETIATSLYSFQRYFYLSFTFTYSFSLFSDIFLLFQSIFADF